MKKEISHKWFFQQSPTEVWDYLTKPELIEQWLMKNDFLPIIGHQFQFRHAPSSSPGENIRIHYCEVLEVVPPQKLSYSWRVEKGKGESALDSIVVWTLSEKNGGTELHLLHNGFTLLEDVMGHANGWNSCLYKFTQLLYTRHHANTNA